ncbi:MAG: glycosyltransferase [Chloroflexi bacterium]|nr:glycosyltransferase [Chloroflexota bacterium]
MLRVAVLSVHTCPLAPLGGWETGGMNVYVRELSRELGKLGVATDVFTRRQDPDVPTVVELGEHARVVHVDAGPPRHMDKYEVVDYLSEFACNLQRFRNFVGARYDLIHAHYWLSGRLATLFQEHWGVPVVAMFHTLAQMKNRVAVDASELEQQIRVDIERRTMATADRVIAATDVDRAQMLMAYGANPRTVTVVPGGVNLGLFRPGSRRQARRALGFGDERVLLFVGRIQRLKGIDLLLRAAAELADDPAGLRIVIVGGISQGAHGRVSEEERESARLHALAAELGLERLTDFVGPVPHERLPLFYRAADVTVMPSTYESFGLVAVESLACGTPVVASRVGGLPTIVRDGENGFLIPWRHPRLFADKIRAVLTDPTLRRRLRRNGLATAQHFGWSAVAERTLDVYDTVLSRRASTRALLVE